MDNYTELCNLIELQLFGEEVRQIESGHYITYSAKAKTLHEVNIEAMTYIRSETSPKLTVSNTYKQIIEIYKKYGYIELRPYNNEDTIVFCCGNTPIEPVYINCKEDHNHKDQYTIDENPLMNPSIIGSFGYHKFETIPTNSINSMIFEGVNTTIVSKDEIYTENIMNRIGTPDLKVKFSIIEDMKKYIEKEGINLTDDNSYY